MLRPRSILLLFLIAFAAVVAFSCDSASSSSADGMAKDGNAVSGTAGFAGAPSDAPPPVPLAAPEAAEGAAPRRAAVGRMAASAPPGTEESTAIHALATLAQQPGAMLIRTGNATVQVDSVDVGIARIRRLAQETGALVANTVVQAGNEQRRSASLELRVPSERFDAVVNGLAPIGTVEAVNISVQDVGEEFVDLTARVANARRLEARLIELLANRTGRLSDVLTVERELARVREEIERYEGRLRYLQSRSSVSSLTVTVHESAPVVASHPGQNVIADAFVQAWRNFVFLLAGFISAPGVLVPLAAALGGAYLAWRRWGRDKVAPTPQT